MIDKVKRTERGWAGHLCVADNCTFHRNTLLEYKDKKVVVSTVGMYINTIGEIDTIGLERYYETMCFECNYRDTIYHDIDVDKEISFNSKWRIDKPYADNEANDMHENVVEEITQMLIDNKI